MDNLGIGAFVVFDMSSILVSGQLVWSLLSLVICAEQKLLRAWNPVVLPGIISCVLGALAWAFPLQALLALLLATHLSRLAQVCFVILWLFVSSSSLSPSDRSPEGAW